MKYIVIDTEGTGLFRHHNIDADGNKVTARSDEPGQPRMASYAGVLVDEELNIESVHQQYVLPIGWENADGSPMLEMPAEALAINGLTFEFLREHGEPILPALTHYLAAIREGRAVLGFNAQHDGRQMRAELRRAGLPDEFEDTPNTCAMRSLQAAKIKVKKLNGKGGFPRLIDAAAHFGVPGYETEQHHKAIDDALATVFISRELHKMGALLPPAVHHAKNFEGGQS